VADGPSLSERLDEMYTTMLTFRSQRFIWCSYRALRINIIDSSKLFGSLNDGDSLDGNAISKPFTLAINDTRDKDVTPYSEGFSGLDNDIICCYALRNLALAMFGEVTSRSFASLGTWSDKVLERNRDNC
jgi:hypothetical protein